MQKYKVVIFVKAKIEVIKEADSKEEAIKAVEGTPYWRSWRQLQRNNMKFKEPYHYECRDFVDVNELENG